MYFSKYLRDNVAFVIVICNPNLLGNKTETSHMGHYLECRGKRF